MNDPTYEELANSIPTYEELADVIRKMNAAPFRCEQRGKGPGHSRLSMDLASDTLRRFWAYGAALTPKPEPKPQPAAMGQAALPLALEG